LNDDALWRKVKKTKVKEKEREGEGEGEVEGRWKNIK